MCVLDFLSLAAIVVSPSFNSAFLKRWARKAVGFSLLEGELEW